MGFYLTAALLTALCLTTSPGAAADYKYPYHEPFLATATTAILSNDGATASVTSTIVHIAGLSGRNNLPDLEGRGDVSLALYRQKRPAPLLFILAGLGSNPFFGVAPYLASLFYRQGYHVVVLPSPMSWNFALSASRSGAPSYAPEDARDLYEVMQKALTTLRARHEVNTTSINLLAVSLGALEGAYLSVIDGNEKKIGIAKYLLIDPPVDLAYAVKKIDEWNALGAKLGREKSQELIAKAMAIVESFANVGRDNPAVFERLAKKFSVFSTEELQFLIAENLLSQLPELIYVNQAIYDQQLLAAPKNDKRGRIEEAKRLTFTDYLEKIALPLWQKQAGDAQADLQSLIQRGSLERIVDRLRGNPKVHIMHNADDFMAERETIQSLKNALGDQVTLYPYGGHLGNLWFPANKELAIKFFRARP